MKKLILALAMLVPVAANAEVFTDEYGFRCINVPAWGKARLKGTPVNELEFSNASVRLLCTKRTKPDVFTWPADVVCRGYYILWLGKTCRVRSLKKPLRNNGRTLRNGAIDFGDPRKWR